MAREEEASVARLRRMPRASRRHALDRREALRSPLASALVRVEPQGEGSVGALSVSRGASTAPEGVVERLPLDDGGGRRRGGWRSPSYRSLPARVVLAVRGGGRFGPTGSGRFRRRRRRARRHQAAASSSTSESEADASSVDDVVATASALGPPARCGARPAACVPRFIDQIPDVSGGWRGPPLVVGLPLRRP